MILSITPSYIVIQLEKNKKFAKILEGFKKDIEKPLIAILTLNTFANTIGAAGVGVSAQEIWGDKYITLVSIIVTILILVFSEIIPKTIGATYWNKLAPLATYILQVLYFVLYPFVWTLQFITKIFKKQSKQEVSKYDIAILSDLSVKEGVLNLNESKIIKNLLQFSEIKVKDIMTPRTVIVTADENTTIKNLYDKGSAKHFSRIPTYETSKENITGYVLKDDILLNIIQGKGDMPLSICKRDIRKVLDTTPIPELYQILMENKEHIAVVIDSHNGLSGIVSMEDVIETILGIEITDESDFIEDMQKFARKNWEYRAKKQGLLMPDSDEE
jgi:CBS domain containing-hemolysin-like protein